MRQRGAVTVEAAVVLPLVSLSLLLVAQVGLLVSQAVAVRHAAREGARIVAVTNDDERAREAAIAAGDLDPARAEVTIDPSMREVGTPVRVSVRYRAAVIPLVDRFVPGALWVSASAVMRTERVP